MRQSTRPRSKGKAAGNSFPLGIHKASGQWCKKVRQRVYYFGRIEGDPEGTAALEEWLRVKDYLAAGRTPPAKDAAGCTVKELIDKFLTAKESRVDSGELSRRFFEEYRITCTRLADAFGRGRLVVDLTPADFEQLRNDWAKRWGPARLGNEIQRTRTLFKWAYENALIDRPIRYGSSFAKPSRKTMRKHRDAHAMEHGLRMFSPMELRTLIKMAPPVLRAMILLGANCGFGQSDCSELPLAAVDLDRGMIDFPRPKTAVRRRCPLWPETITALREAIDKRPEAKDPADAGLCFLTRCGARWVKIITSYDAEKDENKYAADDAVAKEFTKLLRNSGIREKGERKGLGFYALRHTFRTVADEARDTPAVDLLMGHDDGSMASRYRERIDDDRLRAVVAHVHAWLFAGAKEGGAA